MGGAPTVTNANAPAASGTGVIPNLTSLARLAEESGGRFTERTNDLTLAYARAQRDLTCTYSLGFYIDDPKAGKPRSLTVDVKPGGMRAIHPRKYVVRSDEKRKESLLKAAWVAPEMFQTGVVRAHVYPLRPVSKNEWDALLAVSFPVPLALGKAERREFGAVLSGGSRIVHRFVRTVTLSPDHDDVTSTPQITFLERLELKPGRYTLTAVMSDPEHVEPHSTKIDVHVREIPRKELFLIEPILGRPAGPNVLVVNDTRRPGQGRMGGESSFEPLLVQYLATPTDLATLTQACAVGRYKVRRAKQAPAPWIGRSVLDLQGETLGDLPPVELSLEGEGDVRCQNLLDVLPASSMPDGEYVFEADIYLGKNDDPIGKRVRFAVGAPVDQDPGGVARP